MSDQERASTGESGDGEPKSATQKMASSGDKKPLAEIMEQVKTQIGPMLEKVGPLIRKAEEKAVPVALNAWETAKPMLENARSQAGPVMMKEIEFTVPFNFNTLAETLRSLDSGKPAPKTSKADKKDKKKMQQQASTANVETQKMSLNLLGWQWATLGFVVLFLILNIGVGAVLFMSFMASILMVLYALLPEDFKSKVSAVMSSYRMSITMDAQDAMKIVEVWDVRTDIRGESKGFPFSWAMGAVLFCALFFGTWILVWLGIAVAGVFFVRNDGPAKVQQILAEMHQGGKKD